MKLGKWIFCVSATLAVTGTCFASGTSTVRLGLKVIGHGDSMQKVMDAGGKPQDRKPLIDNEGKKVGERWTYKNGVNKRTIIEFTSDNRVYGVLDVYD